MSSVAMTVQFNGEFLSSEQYISLRTAGKVFKHLQAAVDRAYLYKEGKLYKNARVSRYEYQKDIIWLGETKANCRLFEILSNIKDLNVIDIVKQRCKNINREIIDMSFQDCLDEIREERNLYKLRVENGHVIPVQYKEFMLKEKNIFEKRYVERAIAKEIAAIGSVVRSPAAGESSVNLSFNDDEHFIFEINRKRAEIINKVVNQRTLSDPVILLGVFRGGDIKNKKGKFDNRITGKTSNLLFATEEECIELNKYSGSSISIIGCPVVEYGTYDTEAGDIYFLLKR